MHSAIFTSSFDHDTEIGKIFKIIKVYLISKFKFLFLDSGYTLSNNEYSDYQIENESSIYMPNSISTNNFKYESEMSEHNQSNTFQSELLEQSEIQANEFPQPVNAKKTKDQIQVNGL